MTDNAPSTEARLSDIELRLSRIEDQLRDVIEGLNEPPKRSLRHRFASIHQLQEQVGEVDEGFHRLIDELHNPQK